MRVSRVSTETTPCGGRCGGRGGPRGARERPRGVASRLPGAPQQLQVLYFFIILHKSTFLYKSKPDPLIPSRLIKPSHALGAVRTLEMVQVKQDLPRSPADSKVLLARALCRGGAVGGRRGRRGAASAGARRSARSPLRSARGARVPADAERASRNRAAVGGVPLSQSLSIGDAGQRGVTGSAPASCSASQITVGKSIRFMLLANREHLRLLANS